MTYWRQAGISYLRFSAICAKHVRAALRKDLKAELSRESTIKQTIWKEGKPIRPDA